MRESAAIWRSIWRHRSFCAWLVKLLALLSCSARWKGCSGFPNMTPRTLSRSFSSVLHKYSRDADRLGSEVTLPTCFPRSPKSLGLLAPQWTRSSPLHRPSQLKSPPRSCPSTVTTRVPAGTTVPASSRR
ncbi:hypothetical protein OH77DRAFT_990524 [Trametes cingulata]|nr:hypothetical protein OH77DRAFT_990524 [Trametes cingulata]